MTDSPPTTEPATPPAPLTDHEAAHADVAAPQQYSTGTLARVALDACSSLSAILGMFESNGLINRDGPKWAIMRKGDYRSMRRALPQIGTCMYVLIQDLEKSESSNAQVQQGKAQEAGNDPGDADLSDGGELRTDSEAAHAESGSGVGAPDHEAGD